MADVADRQPVVVARLLPRSASGRSLSPVIGSRGQGAGRSGRAIVCRGRGGSAVSPTSAERNEQETCQDPAVSSKSSCNPTPRKGRTSNGSSSSAGNTFSSHFGKSTPRDPTPLHCLPVNGSPISLDGLWLLIVSQWRTLPEALDGAGLGTCEVFGEEQVHALCSATVGESRADDATAMLMRELRVTASARHATRDRLLSTLGRVPPRQRFRDWANTMLLMFENVLDLGKILSNGGRSNVEVDANAKSFGSWEKSGKVLVERQEFREALLLFDVHLNDATMWFEALCDWPQESVEIGALTRRVVAQPWLEGDADIAVGVGVGAALAPDDITVRLIHTWGDIATAFNLKPHCTKSSRSDTPHRVSRYSSHSQEPPSSPPPQSPPTLDQWMRALRGSSKARLLAEIDVKTEAARQVSLQREALQREQEFGGMSSYSHSYLVGLFPNLSEFMCISRANFFPLELVIVRYSTADHGFLGSAIFPGGRRLHLGTMPFIAIVPLGTEAELTDCRSPRTRATEPQLFAPVAPNTRTGTVALRAPCQIDSGGTDGLWAVQLFASEDGKRAIAPVGAPLPLRVVARPPQVPGRPTLSSCTGSSLTVTWTEPVDDGGTPIVTHVLGVWLASEWWDGATPVAMCREANLWPPYEILGLTPETKYIVRVRCQTAGGSSPWSEASEMLETMRPAPGDVGKPQVGDVTPTSVTVSWGPNDYMVTVYEVQVHPCDGCEPWSLTVAPPAPPAGSPSQAPRSPSPGASKARRGVRTPPRPHTPPAPPSRPKQPARWTKVVVDGLCANSKYRFTVRASNLSGVGPKSEPSEPVLTGPGVPSAPGAPVQLDASQTTITLAWSAPINDGGSPVVRYFLRGSEDADESVDSSAPIELNTRDAATSITVRRLRGNTRYVFRIYALNEAGLSPPSPASKALITGPVAPQPPLEVSVSEAEEQSLTLRWKPPASDGGVAIEQYQIEVFMQSSPEDKYVFCTSSNGVIVTGLRGNSCYTARVCATNSIGCSPYTEMLARTGPVTPGAPGVPRPLGTVWATSVILAWSPPPDDGGSEILGYTLQGHFCGDRGIEPDVACALDTVGARVTLEGLEPQTRYRFHVQAQTKAGAGVFSEWSPIVCTAPPPPLTPDPPSLLTATSQTLTVTWEAEKDDGTEHHENAVPLEFEVAMCKFQEGIDSLSSTDGPQQQQLQQRPSRLVRVRAPPVQFKGLRMFSAYTFQLRARGPGGWSEWSGVSEPKTTTNEWSKEEIVDFLLQKYGGTLGGAFRSFDRDCDGFLNPDDFVRGLDRAGLRAVSEEQKLQLFQEADQADRGVITLRDFSKCFAPTPASRALATSKADTPASSMCTSVRYQDALDEDGEATSQATGSTASASRRQMNQSFSYHTLPSRSRNSRAVSPVQESPHVQRRVSAPQVQRRVSAPQSPSSPNRSPSPQGARRRADACNQKSSCSAPSRPDKSMTGSSGTTPSRRVASPDKQIPGAAKAPRSSPDRASAPRVSPSRSGRQMRYAASAQELGGTTAAGPPARQVTPPGRQVLGRDPKDNNEERRTEDVLLSSGHNVELGQELTASSMDDPASTSNSASPNAHSNFRPMLNVQGPVQKSSSHRLLLPR